MTLTIHDVYQFFNNRQVQLGMNFGLSRMESLLAKLDNPHTELKCIHLAGSNGKGSTLHYIKEMLVAEGFTVGSFTSPFLEVMNEQIQVNHEQISNENFIKLFEELQPIIEQMDEQGEGPTQFEILTAMSFVYFKRVDVDFVLLEAGLGGRLDSTNVIDPLLSIITSISLEHTNILGNTLGEIATEKAGIIKHEKPVFSGVMEQEAAEVIKDKAREKQAPYIQLHKQIEISNVVEAMTGQTFSLQYQDVKLHDLRLQMLGKHQIHNAALAVAVALTLGVSELSIRTGLSKAKWNGRFEKLGDKPLIIIDGAHNPASMHTLIDTLTTYYPDYKYRFVFSALRDKDYNKMLDLIDEVATEIIITEFEHERAAKVEELSESNHHRVVHKWKEAIQEGLQSISEDEVVIVTGSLYFLKLVREYIIFHYKL